MIYNNTSVEVVLSKLFRDWKSFPPEMESDAIEWIGESLEAIGAITGITENVRFEGTTEGNRAELPCDIIKLNAVTVNGKYYPYGTGKFVGTKGDSDRTSPSTRRKNFQIEANYFKTYEESVDFQLDYERIAVDKKGYPKIPDAWVVREAATTYIIMKALECGITHPLFDYRTIVAKWEMIRVKAKVSIKMPDGPRLDTFLRGWKRLIPLINRASQFNENTGDEEILY